MGTQPTPSVLAAAQRASANVLQSYQDVIFDPVGLFLGAEELLEIRNTQSRVIAAEMVTALQLTPQEEAIVEQCVQRLGKDGELLLEILKRRIEW